jgi:type IV secretory pathway VirB4 component
MPTFINQKDVNWFQNKNKEIYKLFFYLVQVYKVKKGPYNTTYNEDANKEFDAPYEVEAYLPDLPGWANIMTKFGMDELRKLKIYFSLDLMKSKGLELPEAGDQIIVQQDTYLVTQTNPVDFGSNIQVPMSHVCELKRIRFEKPDQSTSVQKDY